MIKDERIHDNYRNFITALENLLTRYKEKEEIIKKLDKNMFEFSNTVAKEYILKSLVKEKFQRKRNEIFSCTYVDDEQWKPFDKALDIINDLEQDLLGKEK